MTSSNTGRAVLRDGYLSKRSINSKFFQRWNSRYFVLDDHHCFSYYVTSKLVAKDKNDRDTNQLVLKGVFVLTKDSNVATGNKRFGEQCFEVHTPYVDLLLRAESIEIRNAWVNALLATIADLRHTSSRRPHGKNMQLHSGNMNLGQQHLYQAGNMNNLGVGMSMSQNVMIGNQSALRAVNPEDISKDKLKNIREKAQRTKTAIKLDSSPANLMFNTHVFRLDNKFFEVDKRYTVKKVLGHGAYGFVVSAFDEVTRRNVAIKKIGNGFHNVIDTKRILREIRLLRLLRHPNTAHIIDLMRPSPMAKTREELEFLAHELQLGRVDPYDDVYLVMDEMDTDLQRIILSTQNLSHTHIKFMLFQILKVLVYLHDADVVHRDLKPSNVLVNAKCELRIGDFGLARAIKRDEGNSSPINHNSTSLQQLDKDSKEADMTTYVVTRWYRAPELILASSNYSGLIDIWSVGCIFAELITRKPLFPGDDFMDQLHKILSVTGSPNSNQMKFITDASAVRYVKSLDKVQKKDLKSVLTNQALDRYHETQPELFEKQKHASNIQEKVMPDVDNGALLKIKDDLNSLISPDAIDLLQRMLSFSPDERITALDALKHPYLKDYKDYELIFSNEKLSLNEVENVTLEPTNLRRVIMDEICAFRPNVFGWKASPEHVPATTPNAQQIQRM